MTTLESKDNLVRLTVGVLAFCAITATANAQMPPFRSFSAPYGIVVDTAANRVYWSNRISRQSSVELYDATSQSHRGLPVVSPGIVGFDPLQGRLWVPSNGSGPSVMIVDAANAALVKVVPLTGTVASQALVDASARTVYVLQDTQVAVIDADSYAVEYVDLGVRGYEAVLDTPNHRLYVPSDDRRTLVAVDGAKRSATAIPVSTTPSFAGVSAITQNEVANQVLLLTDSGKTLCIVDRGNYGVTTIPLPGVANRAMAIDATTGNAYVPNPPSNALTIVETKSQAIASIAMPAQPNRIAVNPSTGQIYVGLLYGGVVVMDRATLAYFTIRAGANPGEVSLDVVRNLAYFSDTASVLVVDGNSADATSASYAMAVEYYRTDLDHYVLTADADEIGKLDGSVGWARTGATLGTFRSSDGTTPMCRFYLNPQHGDSHLMMANPVECAATAARFPEFTYESPDVFRVALPDPVTGSCAQGLLAVYRLWNRRTDSNHRYAANVTTRDAMIASGSVGEGYGPDAVGICVPRPPTYTVP